MPRGAIALQEADVTAVLTTLSGRRGRWGLSGLLAVALLVACTPDLGIEAVAIDAATSADPVHDIAPGDRVLRYSVVHRRGEAATAVVTRTERRRGDGNTIRLEQSFGRLDAGDRVNVTTRLGGADGASAADLLSITLEVRSADHDEDANPTDNRRLLGPDGGTIEGPADIVFDTYIPSRLRGILIDRAASARLGLPAGYYRLFEARNADQPHERCIAFVPTGGFPRIAMQRLDPWVFSEFVIAERSPETLAISAFDLQGYQIRLRISFRAECDVVHEAWIDDVPVRITTSNEQGALHTCDLDTEPRWGPH